MKILLFLFALVFCATGRSQPSAEASIRATLAAQTTSWNAGDIEGFMHGYWKNDSLMFIGRNGIVHGWTNALANYKKSYPDTVAMGKLSFDIIVVKKLSAEYYYVVGKWTLKRSVGDLSGHYDLLFRKIGGTWLIIADHSS